MKTENRMEVRVGIEPTNKGFADAEGYATKRHTHNRTEASYCFSVRIIGPILSTFAGRKEVSAIN